MAKPSPGRSDGPRTEPQGEDQVRAAEVIATLSLATDLGLGVPLEHGLQSTLMAMRLCDRLKVDSETAAQTYHAIAAVVDHFSDQLLKNPKMVEANPELNEWHTSKFLPLGCKASSS
jgi:hypothetical protein